MKILIVGNANHQYNINLCRHLKEYYRGNVIIDAFSLLKVTNPDTYKYFDKIYSPQLGFFNKIPKIRYYYRKYNLLELAKTVTDKYDICNIQSFENTTEVLSDFIKSRCNKLIVSYWGSDIYSASDKFIKKQFDLNDNADYITFAAESLADKYDLRFKALSDKKRKTVELGSEPLKEIIAIKNSTLKNNAKSHFHLPLNKYIVQIGYSGQSFHQHLSILERLKALSSRDKDKLFLLLPMTYGLKNSYYKKVLKMLESTNIEHKVLVEFLDDKELALLRMSVDLFVIVTLNDACCSTLLEHIYLGNRIIAGNWLPYKFIESKWGGKLCWVNDLDDLLAKIIIFTSDPDSVPCCSAELEEHVKNKVHWPNVITKWADLYESLLDSN
ncbi:MAG: glycosyltransferase [Syntrophomonadaceae bacterium]